MGNGPVKEGLYAWDSPWAPSGALTDTVPGSPEREFLDRLTDPSGDYHIIPFEIDGGYQKSYGVWNYDEARNNVFRFSEAVEFIEQFPNGWNEFRPLFDEAGILDPLDPRDIPAAIKERMTEIKKRVKKKIGLTPKDKDYCNRFVPRFYEQGLLSFDNGGLCFLTTSTNTDVSAVGDVFKQCAERGITDGKCMVQTFMIYSAFEYAAPQCSVIATDSAPYKTGGHGHVCVEYKGTALDPVRIGRMDDSEHTMLTRRQLMGGYHNNLGIILAEKGDLVSAEGEFRRAIQLREDFPEAHCGLGFVFRKKGDLAGAESEYRRAIQLREDYPLAHRGLAGVLRAMGKDDEAKRHFKRYKELISK